MKTLVVVNPHASHGQSGSDFQEKIRPVIEARLGDFAVHITKGPGDATDFLRANPDYERVISVGGDGTLNEIVNGLIQGGSKASVGVIAVGSGNDFARAIDLPRDYEKMVTIAIGQKTREIDLFEVRHRDFQGEMATRYAVNVVGAGFDAAITNRMNKSRFNTSGKTAYLLSFLIEFITCRTYSMSFSIDGKPVSSKYYFLTMGNGNYFGGGMRIAPDAVIDDGVIDVVGVGKMAKLRLLYHFPKIYKGEHLKVRSVYHYTASKLTVASDRDVIIQMDGEVVGKLPMDISVHRKSLKIASP